MIKKFRYYVHPTEDFAGYFTYSNQRGFNFVGNTVVIEGFATVNMENIQQFTGLLDKNGCEIYEGDIVKIGDRIKEVEFKMGIFYIDEEYGDFVLVSEVDNIIEVIGNIFENPLDNLSIKD